MKKLLFLSIFIMMTSCATVEFKGSNQGLFQIQIETVKDGKPVLVTVTAKADVQIVDGQVIMDTSAYVAYEDESGRYTCTVKIGSDGNPIKDILVISEDCELVYGKKPIEKKTASATIYYKNYYAEMFDVNTVRILLK